MLRLVKKTNILTSRCLTTTPMFCGEDTTEVSYEKAKPYSSIPSPLSLPVIGSGYLLKMKHESGVPYIKDFSLLTCDLTKKLGSIFKLNLFGYTHLMLSDPKDIAEVFRTESEFPKVPSTNVLGTYKEMSKDLYPSKNKGFVGLDGPEWWKTRYVVNKCSGRKGVAEAYIPGLEEIADDFIKLCTDHILDENNDTPEDFVKEVIPWATESMFYILLDVRLGELTAEAINDKSRESKIMLETLGKVKSTENKMLGATFWKKYPNLSPSFKRLDKAYRTMYSIADKHYRIKEEELKKLKPWNSEDSFSSGNRESSFVANVYQECRGDPDLERAPFNVLLEYMSAGQDGASKAVGHLLYNLASNPDKQQTVYEEIMREIGDNPITAKSLNRLKFFTACSKESQRLNPPILGIVREIQSPTVIKGYQIPPGTSVLMDQMTLNQMHVPSPDEFVPERYIRGSNHPLAKSVPEFGLLSFGFGRRQCPARRLITTCMDVLMVKMLKEFRIEQSIQSAINESRGVQFNYRINEVKFPGTYKLRLVKRNK